MPLVTVLSRPGVLSRRDKVTIRGVVGDNGSYLFSQTKLRLSPADFSYHFDTVRRRGHTFNFVSEYSAIVVINLHNFPERVAGKDDNAIILANQLARVLQNSKRKRSFKIGVMLLHSDMGWGTSSVEQTVVTRSGDH